MSTLELLRQRIDTTTDLRSVVATMKTLAAVSIHQYERAADALADYNRTVELGLQIVLRDEPRAQVRTGDARNSQTGSLPDPSLGVIVLGSDQGMCGQFNEQIAAHAIEHHASHSNQPPAATWVVGGRVTFPLTDAGWEIDETFRIPTSVPEIADRVSELLTSVERLREERELTTLRIYSNQRSHGQQASPKEQLSAGAYRPSVKQLLPIDSQRLQRLQEQRWESRSLPTFAGKRDELRSLLITQSLYVLLYRACAESLASENASRIAAMQAAEKNIDETLEELATAFKVQRQTAITEELLDVVIGFEALMS